MGKKERKGCWDVGLLGCWVGGDGGMNILFFMDM
jgi:hypothetical protein